MYGFKQPNDSKQIEHLGKGFLQVGQHVNTGFWRESHEFATMPS
jgi:hypothetical protein